MGIQRELEKKWKTPYFNQKLTSIKFNEVGLRGVKNSIINFDYPITAIAGANGIGKTTILQLIACLYHNNTLGKAIAIADGDLTEKELRGWYKNHILKSYQGELFDEEIFKQKEKELFCKFAGDNAPEKFMLEKLQENEAYARYVDDSDEFVSFLAHEISLSDHHGLFRVIGERIGLGEESVMRDVIRGLLLFYGGEFDVIVKFIKFKLEEN